ncbi:hypothetical protein DFH11DRAFT_1217127 [Phellopilus nigrolimitatus]|nr:hypothetical protein DFH11DRAFT_1217127 [Phellopilus nigrolimitatus]
MEEIFQLLQLSCSCAPLLQQTMGDTVHPIRLGRRRLPLSGNSPDRKHQQRDARRLSKEADAEISNFIRSAPGTKTLAFGFHTQEIGTISGSVPFLLRDIGPCVLSNLVDFCGKCNFKNFDADLKNVDKCRARLAQMSNEDVDELGRLFCVAFILALDGPKAPSERLFSVSTWEEVLNHAFFDAPSAMPTYSR